MTKFTIHSLQTAPAAAQPLLRGAQAKLGFVPNLYAGLAESPATLSAYLQLSERVAETSLTPVEVRHSMLSLPRATDASRCSRCCWSLP